jgi:energy-coupling factor transporter transmembrane protein EcfT
VLRVPVVVVVILGMAYRYIFLLIDSARDMLESRRSRMVGTLPGPERRRLAAASVGVLMSKTMQLSGDVYSAMLSRGFRGEVYMLDDFRTAALDWIMLGLFSALAAGAFYWGR